MARRRKKRRSPLPVLILFAAAALLTVGLVKLYPQMQESSATADLNSYFGVSDGEAALVVNNEILDARGVVKDDDIYVDYDTVTKYFNDMFCWDKDSQQMLLTLPKGTEIYKDGDGSLLLIDGKPYLSASCIKEDSDIDMEVFDSPERIVARTVWDNVPTETVTQDTKLRTAEGKRSEILTSLSRGDTVILTQNADKWCCVSTSDGFTGYVEKESLESGGELTHTSAPGFSYSKITMKGKVILGWQYAESDSGASQLTQLTNGTGVNVVSPTWFRVTDRKGTVASIADSNYTALAHQAGISVWGCYQDVNDGDGISAGDYLSSYSTRQHIITQLMDAAESSGMDGINLDIETITEETTPLYLQFIRELCEAAHKKNLIVSVDNYASVYTKYLNRAEQAKTADYLVIMGYDEHTAGSTEAGSVSSLPFVEEAITDLIGEGVEPSQIIEGIPFYSRGWTQAAGEEVPSSETLAMGDQQSWADMYGIHTDWDAKLGQYTGSSSTEDGVTHSIWIEDDRSIEEKMKLIRQYDLAGVAAWRLGLEDSGVWSIIRKYME